MRIASAAVIRCASRKSHGIFDAHEPGFSSPMFRLSSFVVPNKKWWTIERHQSPLARSRNEDQFVRVQTVTVPVGVFASGSLPCRRFLSCFSSQATVEIPGHLEVVRGFLAGDNTECCGEVGRASGTEVCEEGSLRKSSVSELVGSVPICGDNVSKLVTHNFGKLSTPSSGIHESGAALTKGGSLSKAGNCSVLEKDVTDVDVSLGEERKQPDRRRQITGSLTRLKPHGDRLLLRGMKFHGYHGVYPEEKMLGQKFLVDVDAWVDLRKAGVTDQLEDSVSYAEIYRNVKDVVEGPSHSLLESVANAIACDILGRYPTITDIRVRVCKPHVAVVGIVDFIGVEILRDSSHGNVC